jgi:uncharacterized protein involved in exopolysaccharide biosynthesis
MKPRPPRTPAGPLKVWLQLIGLLALIFVVGYAAYWLELRAR